MIRLCYLSVLILLTLSIRRVESTYFAYNSCEGTCESLLESSCEAAAATYDFYGECCSLSTNENGTCTLKSTTTCGQADRTYPCYWFGPPDETSGRCLGGGYRYYEANSTDECPASEIDVLNRGVSVTYMWTGLTMILVGVTELSDEDIENWQETTSDHFLHYYDIPGGDVRDVVGYVALNYFTFADTGNEATITYSPQAAWRTDADSFDPITLVKDPFTSVDGAPAYIEALNEVGIPAMQAIVLIPETVAPHSTDVPTSPPIDRPTGAPVRPPVGRPPTGAPVVRPPTGPPPTGAPVVRPSPPGRMPTGAPVIRPIPVGIPPTTSVEPPVMRPPTGRPPTVGAPNSPPTSSPTWNTIFDSPGMSMHYGENRPLRGHGWRME